MNEIDPRLLDAFKAFDALCRENGIRYTIDANEDDYQAYSIRLGDPSKITENLDINTKWINVRRSDSPAGTLFEFSTKVFGEDQYKSPTRKHVRDQTMWPSSFGPSKTFGGVGGRKPGTKKLKKKIAEALKLKDDLLAHDNVTNIPSGTELEVHDPDPGLPDVDYGGTTRNVDRCKLGDAIDKKSEEEYKKIFKEGVLNEQHSSLGAFLTSKIHEGYTVAADRAFAAGYMNQDERIALSTAITDALKAFTEVMTDKFPNLYARQIDSKDIFGMSGTFRERIERRISDL